jgi:uncharacterized phage protein gp47/JayE
MPLTLRSKNLILENLASHLLAGGVITDFSPISVIRQLLEAVAATQSDLDYALFTLLQGFYISTAEGEDLDIRGRDMGLARDAGQAASDPVVLTKEPLWIDDIALPAPQVFQAILADGTPVLYRSLGNAVLRASGRSVSGQAPGTVITNGTNAQVALNLDGDGIRTVNLGTQLTGVAIASALQAAVVALTAITPVHQAAYNAFRCDYGVTTPGAYTLRSGTAGPTSTVVVTTAASADASTTLKLGLAHGGTETVGAGTLSLPVICDTLGVLGNVGPDQIRTLVSAVPGIVSVTNPLAFANGREAASDDAYRQDITTYILGLGRGTRDGIERAVASTLGADGQTHVLSFQVLNGVNNVQVYVCDGRSLTVGAQSDVLQAVQDELDGLGQEPGGWLAMGNTAGAVPAIILPVDLDVLILMGSVPDLVRGKLAVTNMLYNLLYNWPVGQALSYATVATRIDQTLAQVLDVIFTTPGAFTTTPKTPVGGELGQKIMPRVLNVRLERA